MKGFFGNVEEPFYRRHRGPFRLMVTRKGKKGPQSEWLSGLVEGPDVAEEAQSLLTDPRDSVLGVYVWSEKESQFVTAFPARPGEAA